MIQPTLSPTEDRFAYSTGSGFVEVMDIATRTRTPIVDHLSPQPQVSRPFWSHDGTKVMFVDNDRINPRFREGYNKLRVADIATKTATWYPVGPMPAAVSDRTEGAAAWSPDGTKVAFISDSVLKVMPIERRRLAVGSRRAAHDGSRRHAVVAGRFADAPVHVGRQAQEDQGGRNGAAGRPARADVQAGGAERQDDHPRGCAVGCDLPRAQARRGYRHRRQPDHCDRAAQGASPHAEHDVRRCLPPDGVARLLGSALPSAERLPGQPVQPGMGGDVRVRVHVGAVGGRSDLREHRDPRSARRRQHDRPAALHVDAADGRQSHVVRHVASGAQRGGR